MKNFFGAFVCLSVSFLCAMDERKIVRSPRLPLEQQSSSNPITVPSTPIGARVRRQSGNSPKFINEENISARNLQVRRTKSGDK